MAFQLENIKTSKIEKESKGLDTTFLQKEITIFGNSFSNKVKEDFYTELSVLLKAGITLRSALELIENATKKKQNKTKLAQLSGDIVSGASLSESLKKHKDFSDYEYFSIKIGEETGNLAKVSEQLGEFFARKNEQRRNIVSALTYPFIILSTAVLVVIFMLNYVVPMFQDIFEQQKVDLPAITEFIISLSDFLKSHGWIFTIFFLGIFFLSIIVKKKEWFRKYWDYVLLKIPFVGNFLKMVYLSQFTQAVSLLTSSKVPIVNSIQLVRQMINFYPLQKSLGLVEAEILIGKSLSDSLKEQPFFDDKMVALVRVAEETNQNEFIFERLNTQYTTQVQQKSKMLSTVLEPFIIMIVGLLVGVILIAMYLPMFKLSSVMG